MKKIYLLFLGILFCVLAKAQCPSFSINAPNGTTVGCNPNTVPLSAVNTSTLSSITYTWIGSVSGTTTGININATAPNTYSVYASSPSSTCIAMQMLSLTSNTSVPYHNIAFFPNAITCSNPTISMTLMSPFPSTVPVTFTFTSPPPTSTSNIAGATFSVPGTYTAQYTNTQNGCTATTMTNVPLNTTPPSTMALSDFTLCSSSPTVMINGGATFTLSSYTYTWTGPGAISSPNNYNTAVNAIGLYSITIQNSTNGCSATNTANVVSCSGIHNLNGNTLNIEIFPNPIKEKFNLKVNDYIVNGELKILDVSGREVYSLKINQGNNEIFASGLAKEIYYYVILQNKEPVKKGKIVIE